MDVTQLVQQLSALAVRAADNRQQRESLLTKMRAVFDAGFDVDAWQDLCAQVARLPDTHWSGALFNTPETANIWHERGEEPPAYALIASDGSQIMPDRHKSVQYAAIQVASSCIVYGDERNAPSVADAIQASQHKPLRFLSDDELVDPASGELVTPGEISTQRDLAEIGMLAQQAEQFAQLGLLPVAVCDGSLIPFALLNEMAVRGNPRRSRELLDHVMAALNRLRACGAIVAGYIDRPNSNALARACVLSTAPESVRSDEGLLREWVKNADRDVLGIFDRHILEDILPPMQRTALFEPQWLINSAAFLGEDAHTIRACYLNVSAARPTIARLEVPHWCSDAASMGILTAMLSRQADMGAGYPLCLKAAHEAAILTHADERQIDTAIERQILESGVLMTPSSKQEAKDRR